MKKNLTKDILKWIALIPISILLTLSINTLIDFFTDITRYSICLDSNNRWVDCFNLNGRLINNLWLDTTVVFFSLWLCLKFIGERYYKPATIVLFIFRMSTLLFIMFISSSGITSVSFLNVIPLILPTLLSFSFVFYRGIYKKNWDFLN